MRDGDSLYLVGHDTLDWQTGSDWRSVRQEASAAGAVLAVREWTPYGVNPSGLYDEIEIHDGLTLRYNKALNSVGCKLVNTWNNSG